MHIKKAILSLLLNELQSVHTTWPKNLKFRFHFVSQGESILGKWPSSDDVKIYSDVNF